MEPWVVDWEKRRLEREEELKRKEEERQAKIEKNRKLEESWALAKECRKILREPRDGGKEARIMERKEIEERAERLAKAQEKKKANNNKLKQREITEMLQMIPKEDAESIEEKMKSKEREELEEMKREMFKNWRGGKKDIKRMRMRIPNEEEKIEKKIRNIKTMIEEYWTENKRKKGEEKKKLKREKESKWEMMKWLTMYIEKNKYAWEERRKRQEEMRMEEEESLQWKRMSKEEQIEMMMETEARSRNKEKERKEKAEARNTGWKTWRDPGGGESRVKNKSQVEKYTLPNEETQVDPEGLMQLYPNQIPTRRREEGDEMKEMKARSEEMKEKRNKWRKDHSSESQGKPTPDHIPTNTSSGCNVARDDDEEEREGRTRRNEERNV